MIRSIGRNLIYDSIGQIIYDSGEHKGNIKIKTAKELFPSYDENTQGLIKLSYGERSQEISNRGSWEVVNDELVIYPHFTHEIDKNQIIDDGQDEVVITVNTESDQVTFYVAEDDVTYTANVTNGQATFSFSSEVIGTYNIEINTDKHGSAAVQIEVVASA